MESLGNIINIYDQFGSHNSLSEKMQTLKRNCEALCCQQDDVNTELQYAESSSRKQPRLEVENWLTNVQTIKNKVDDIDREVRGSGVLGRVQLVNRVENLTTEVTELREQGKFPEGLTLNAHARGVALMTAQLVGETFHKNLESIWGYLMKPEVLIIGIWGMGGVGKTTLVTHIHNRVREQLSAFYSVYWVTASQNPDIHKLQDDIAKEINLDEFDEEDERKRAAILSSELRRRRCVFILDDIWNAVSLERVGVPVEVNGCKLIITTRSLEVCRRLGCQEKIKVQPLSEEEAWYLFKRNLGRQRVALSPELLEVAMQVARECAGLPLGIITVARCMREVNDVREWRNALHALIESKVGLIEMEEEVFQVLKFSYSRLNDTIAQQCFLYCALYPEDHRILREELIQCFIDEGLIGRMRGRQAKFDRGHAILNKLANSCLLEPVICSVDVGADVNVVEAVKMHDLVRDMAIKMSPQFMVKAGMQLDEMPDEEEWSEDVERVSLMNNKIEVIPWGTSPMCPKILTFFLSSNGSLKRFENSFFEHMSTLQVLDLSWNVEIKELPISISNLKKLSALVLHGCKKLQLMPSLAELKSLKRLDLGYCGIREVPYGLDRLVNLTYLDLCAVNLERFPAGILPMLSRLEYLKFEYSRSNAVKIRGEELRCLARLTTFAGHLICDDLNDFNAYVNVMWTRQDRGPNCSYNFRVNGDKYAEETYSRHDNLNVRIENWSISKTAEDPLDVLRKDVRSLKLVKCHDVRSLCDVSFLDNGSPIDLKECVIMNCEGIECVGSFAASSYSSSSYELFQTLENLDLMSLPNLGTLFKLEGEGEREGEGSSGASPPILLPIGVFSSLQQLHLWDCPKLKKLFLPWFLPNLRNLEEIRVNCCNELEEIIAAEVSNNNHSTLEFNLPKLRVLSLNTLPELKSICAEMMTCDALQEIKVWNCPKLKKIPLSRLPSSLQSVTIPNDEWWALVEWDHPPNAKSLLQPYLHFLATNV